VSSDVYVKVAGLAEFRRGLRGIDKGSGKQVRAALNQVAQVLVDEARPEIPSVTGAARSSLRAQSSQTTAKVAAGGPKAPYYAWLDFGGRVGRRKQTKRAVISGGRYIYPTLEREREKINRVMLEAMTQLAAANGIEVD